MNKKLKWILIIIPILILFLFLSSLTWVALNIFNLGPPSDYAITSRFKDHLQNDIDPIWKNMENLTRYNYTLPSVVKEVCFIDPEKEFIGDITQKEKYDFIIKNNSHNSNLFVYPYSFLEELSFSNIKHINIEKITETENPYCFKNDEERIYVSIEKDKWEALVRVSR